MKQSEKLDLILKELYKYYKDGNSGYYSVKDILEVLNIVPSTGEAWQLGKRLKDEGLINGQGTLDDMLAEINSYGIEYCEEDSFSHKGHPLITQNNINISNSSGLTIVQSSPGVIINHPPEELKEILERIYMAIQVSAELNEELQTEATERLTEIKEYIEATNKLPKYGMNDLLSLVGNMSSIASLLLTLK